jgi:hypothetical protein
MWGRHNDLRRKIMSAGISRVHGSVAAPSQRPSTLSFFNISFPAAVNGQVGVVDGAIDRIFRDAVSQIGVVAMIGTVGNNGTGANRDLRFAIEDTGADSLSPSYLGTGPTNASPASTAAALEDAIQALGTVNSIALGSATVTAFTL